MSKSLLDLLNKTRGDIASKRGNNVDLTRLKDGNNYLRIFPNKDDPNGVFFQTFGMHYVKHQNEEGKDVTTAYICEQHTHGQTDADHDERPADERQRSRWSRTQRHCRRIQPRKDEDEHDCREYDADDIHREERVQRSPQQVERVVLDGVSDGRRA